MELNIHEWFKNIKNSKPFIQGTGPNKFLDPFTFVAICQKWWEGLIIDLVQNQTLSSFFPYNNNNNKPIFSYHYVQFTCQLLFSNLSQEGIQREVLFVIISMVNAKEMEISKTKKVAKQKATTFEVKEMSKLKC